MRRLFVLAAMLAIGAPAAHAASFDCKRAATVVERAVCADPRLSALDEREVAAYTAAAAALTIGETPDDRDPVSGLLLLGHQDWSAARDRCGAATACLLSQYQRRIAVLGFHPDPQAATRLDGWVGRYGTSIDPPREMVIMHATGDSVLVGIIVGSGDGSCSFNGIGRPDGRGGLLVTHKDFDTTKSGDHAIRVSPTRLGLGTEHASRADDVSARFCTAGGSLQQPFPKRSE